MTRPEQPPPFAPEGHPGWSDAAGNAATAAVPPLRPILLADDDASSLQLIEMRLEVLRLSNPLIRATDGDQAVARLTECAALGTPAALVLLDGQMPGRSGLEVLAWMREQPAYAQVPVVLLTGDSCRDAIREAYASGATSYLIKPVGFSALADVLRGIEAPWALI